MCIDYKFPEEDRKKWLEDKPETIIAYKIVEIKRILQYDKERLYPYYVDKATPFERKNHIKQIKTTVRKSIRKAKTYIAKNSNKKDKCSYEEVDRCSYMAYYHLWANIEEAKQYLSEWAGYGTIIECKVPKKYITDIGEQCRKEVIVTRQFTIVGQDEYLD